MLRLQGGVSTATSGADPPAVVEALAAALHVVPAVAYGAYGYAGPLADALP